MKKLLLGLGAVAAVAAPVAAVVACGTSNDGGEFTQHASLSSSKSPAEMATAVNGTIPTAYGAPLKNYFAFTTDLPELTADSTGTKTTVTGATWNDAVTTLTINLSTLSDDGVTTKTSLIIEVTLSA